MAVVEQRWLLNRKFALKCLPNTQNVWKGKASGDVFCLSCKLGEKLNAGLLSALPSALRHMPSTNG